MSSVKIWSTFILYKHCSFLPHSFITLLFFPLSTPASLLFLFRISFDQVLKRSTVGEEHFPSFSRQQSNLVCSLPVSVVELFLLILSLVTSSLMPRPMIWLTPLLLLPHPYMLPEMSITLLKSCLYKTGSVASFLNFTEYVYQTCREFCFHICRC